MNFTALLRILTSTSRRRTGSTSTFGIFASSRWILKLISLFVRKPFVISSAESVILFKSAGTGLYFTFPLSTRVRSNTSLISDSKYSELSSIFSRQFFTSSDGLFFIAIPVNPMIAFIGVLISWDICDRNAVFALFAACACSASSAISSAVSWAAFWAFFLALRRIAITAIVVSSHPKIRRTQTVTTGCRRIQSTNVRSAALYVVYRAARSSTRFWGMAYIAFVRMPASA